MTKSLRPPASDAVDRLLNPKSIAVVGSLREARFGGHVTASNLLRFGFKGRIYPVNPQYREVLNLPVYPSVKDIPEPVDLVITMAGAAAISFRIDKPGLVEVRAASEPATISSVLQLDVKEGSAAVVTVIVPVVCGTNGSVTWPVGPVSPRA